ncbi:hypothetical protein G7K_4831-t1 [Saitoella complicata NRRL Y-17804]|uniref:RNA helicase n=1 Tax=Saitoella complicata (strain BCRC 22490 / CBS 7301 / JCM 7358 / NBRC 10748 / NRRL Y-17804) TaxID=698492 RepID=A0A0E9NMR0_SAICN|nr:hypothetical protein G7K_4831-t1 [Saitoella complicata NRRL Y-17804]
MDAFRLLGAGASFKKNGKFARDHELFNAQPARRDPAEAARAEKDIERELDFFHTAATQPSASVTADEGSLSKKRKRNHNDDHAANGSLTTITTAEEANAHRKANRIKVTGTDVPYPFASFSDLLSRFELRSFLKRNLDKYNFNKPTPIQMQAIPILLHKRDLLAIAPTGSGKTLAFVLPMVQDLKAHESAGFRALIISPTRELAQQIYNEVKKLTEGRGMKVCMLTKATAATQAQAPELRQKFDILISTPLRLVHALQQESIDLSNVRHLIMDEADKLFELGFLEQTDEILAACSSPALQKALFSATLPSSIEQLANTVMKDPVRVIIGSKEAAAETIDQKLVYAGNEQGKLIAIRNLVQTGGLKPPCLVFVQSIERAKALFHELVYDGLNVDVIHGERTKAQRDAVIDKFREGQIWILIATDVMARGIDFKGVNLVINYDFPQSVQSYVHRIGRTGRAGRRGEAVTYFTKDDAEYLKSIVNVMRQSGCEVEDWLLKLKKPSQEARKKLKKKPVDRRNISTQPKVFKEKRAHKKDIIENSKKKKAPQQEVVTASDHEGDEAD